MWKATLLQRAGGLKDTRARRLLCGVLPTPHCSLKFIKEVVVSSTAFSQWRKQQTIKMKFIKENFDKSVER